MKAKINATIGSGNWFQWTARKMTKGLFSVGLALTGFAHADVLVNYGPSADYVTANVTFSRTATRTLNAGTYTYLNSFSDTSALSPASSYTGPAFYGGYSYVVNGASAAPSALSQQSIYNNERSNNTYDDISLQSYYNTGWAGTTMSLASVFVFKLSSPSSVTDLSTFVSSNTANTFRTGATWRWVIQTGGSYYVSQSTFNAGGSYTPYQFTLTGLSGAMWAVYTPSDSLNFDQSAATYATVDTTNVTAVGLYLENDSWAGDSAAIGFDVAIQSFTATGVPEPKSSALLWIGGLLLAGLKMRKTQMVQ